MTLNIFPSSPAPDIALPDHQQKSRIVSKSEYGYEVKRHRSNIAIRRHSLSYTNITSLEKNSLRNFIIQQDYGLTSFLFKHPTDNITEYGAANQDGTIELANETTGNIAQGFQLPFQSAIHKIQLYLNKTGSPAGQLTVKINSDSSGKPSSSTLATSDNVAASTITGTLTLTEFNFTIPVRLEAFTQYHLLLEGDATYDASFVTGATAVQLGIDASSPSYTYGNISTYAAGAWTADSAKCAIFTVPDYTKVRTDDSLWATNRISNAGGGMYNVNIILVEDLG